MFVILIATNMPKSGRRSIKNPKIFCEQCKLVVKEEESDNSIQCDRCSKTFHSLCTKLNKRQFEQLMDDENIEYICHLCCESGENENSNINSELNLIKTKLNKLDQLDDMHKSMMFMSKQFDELLKGVTENKKKIDAVQKENKMLKAEISELKQSVKMLNDSRVKNDCLVNGVENVGDATAVDTIITIMKKVEVDLKPEEIDAAYFLKKKNNTKKQTIVVKCNTFKTKQALMAAKSKLMEKEETKSIYVNDFLSRETLALLNHARTLNTVGYRRVYVHGGRVFTKRSELSKPKLIRCAEEVDELLLEATTNRSRRSKQFIHVDSGDDSDVERGAEYLSPSNN